MLIYYHLCLFTRYHFIKYSPITPMKRLKISSKMFSLTQISRKRLDLKNTVDVKSVMKSIHILIGAEHAMPDISETTLVNGPQEIKKLIILFKILKFIHGVISWYWNGIRGQHFQKLKK